MSTLDYEEILYRYEIPGNSGEPLYAKPRQGNLIKRNTTGDFYICNDDGTISNYGSFEYADGSLVEAVSVFEYNGVDLIFYADGDGSGRSGVYTKNGTYDYTSRSLLARSEYYAGANVLEDGVTMVAVVNDWSSRTASLRTSTDGGYTWINRATFNCYFNYDWTSQNSMTQSDNIVVANLPYSDGRFFISYDYGISWDMEIPHNFNSSIKTGDGSSNLVIFNDKVYTIVNINGSDNLNIIEFDAIAKQFTRTITIPISVNAKPWNTCVFVFYDVFHAVIDDYFIEIDIENETHEIIEHDIHYTVSGNVLVQPTEDVVLFGDYAALNSYRIKQMVSGDEFRVTAEVKNGFGDYKWDLYKETELIHTETNSNVNYNYVVTPAITQNEVGNYTLKVTDDVRTIESHFVIDMHLRLKWVQEPNDLNITNGSNVNVDGEVEGGY